MVDGVFFPSWKQMEDILKGIFYGTCYYRVVLQLVIPVARDGCLKCAGPPTLYIKEHCTINTIVITYFLTHMYNQL